MWRSRSTELTPGLIESIRNAFPQGFSISILAGRSVIGQYKSVTKNIQSIPHRSKLKKENV
jgi:hypothetical protein